MTAYGLLIDYEFCTGCHLCVERTEKGQQPFCVHHCLAGVMQWGTVEDLAKELEEKPNQVLFVPKPYQY